MWNFLQGYVIIKVSGLSLERFLNLMLRAGLRPRQVERCGVGGIRLRVRARDFKKLRPIRRKCNCRIHISERHGTAFALADLWRRKVLLIGCTLALLSLFALSTRVLFIRFIGCENMDEAALHALLAEEGITPFAAWRELDNLAIATRIAAQCPEAAWLGITREGVVITVEAAEAIPKIETPDLSVLCDVVAQKDGMVTRITALRGQPRVAVGDFVAQGDVLISSEVVYNEETAPYYTHAMGEVWVAHNYSAKVKAPAYVQEYRKTGEQVRYGKLNIAGCDVWERAAPYPWFALDVRDVCVWDQYFVPIRLTRGAYLACVPTSRPMPRAQQEEEACMRAEMQAMWQVPKDAAILVKSCFMREEADGLYGFCVITTEESIGYQRKIESGYPYAGNE